MADVLSPIYKFTEPEVGGSDDTWGDKLNANWAKLDTLLGQAFSGGSGSSVGTLKPGVLPTDNSFPYVKKTGDTITGVLYISNTASEKLRMTYPSAAVDQKNVQLEVNSGGSFAIRPMADNYVSLPGYIYMQRGAGGVEDLLFVGGIGYSTTPPAAGSVINKERGDSRYLQLSGGTVAGALTVTGKLTVTAAGGIDISVGPLSVAGQISAGGIITATTAVYVDSSTAAANSHLYFRSNTQVNRGLIYAAATSDEIRVRPYNLAGSAYADFIFNSSGQLTVPGAADFGGGLTVTGAVDASGNILGDSASMDNPGTNVMYWMRQGGANRAILFYNHSDATLRLQLYAADGATVAGSLIFNRSGQIFASGGAEIIGLNASNLSTGTVPQARLTAAIVAGAYSGIGAGNVGTYAFAIHSSGSIGYNATVAASTLTPCNASGASGSAISAGTWRCMGWCGSPDADDRSTLWLRVS